MNYLGSKSRIAKSILAVINDRTPIKNYKYWIEPFVGGGNMISAVDHPNRIGYDVNEFVIKLMKALQNGWVPPDTLSESEYARLKVLKSNPESPEAHLVAFAGFCCSFGSKWFGGYARSYEADGVTLKDLPNAGSRSLRKQIESLKGCRLFHGSYLDGKYPADSIIYCDPPYANTTQYRDAFDHGKFWQWVRERIQPTYVSEYNAPDDFECVWQQEVKTNFSSTRTTAQTRVEKLFIYKR